MTIVETRMHQKYCETFKLADIRFALYKQNEPNVFTKVNSQTPSFWEEKRSTPKYQLNVEYAKDIPVDISLYALVHAHAN